MQNTRLVSNGTTVAVQGLTNDFKAKFVAALRKLEAAKTGKYAGRPGIHSVYSGLNGELRRKGLDPIATVQALIQLGVIESHPTKGGAMIYVKGEQPKSERSNPAFGLLD